MKALFIWLDGHPGIYWGLGGAATTLFLGWLGWAWRYSRESRGSWCRGDRVAVGLLLLVLLAWRWPVLFETKTVGFAESQLIAGALALERDAVPFRSADLGESGWLAAAVLLPTHWLRIPQDYFNARVVALLLDWGTLAVGYAFLRGRLPAGAAMLGVLPLALVLSTPGVPAGDAYSGWHLVWLLAALAGWRLARLGEKPRPAWPGWLAASLWLAFIPWAHRAGWWVAAGVWVAVGASTWRHAKPGAANMRCILWAGALALYVNVALLCLWHGIGQWERFRASYATGAALGAWVGPEPAGWSWWHGGIVLAVLAAGLLRARAGSSCAVVVIFLALSGLGLVAKVGAGTPDIFGRLAACWRQPYSELGVRIRAMRRPDESLVVWGGRPQLYVETGLPPAVSSAVSAGEILASNPARALFRTRYLREIMAGKPQYFVDAGTPELAGHAGRARSGHEVFPELADYIENHYRLVSDDGQTRLYLRFARVAETPPHLARVIALQLAKVRVVQVMAPLSEIEDNGWFAHAPCEFTHPVPLGVTHLGGVFGFLPPAYADPFATTDGATFIIEAVARDGRRERLLERHLAPASNPADRGSMAFDVALPPGAVMELRFRIEPGGSSNRDWTYWGHLQFEKRP